MADSEVRQKETRELEYDAFWRKLTLKGDPLYVPNKLRTGFNAGFEAGMRAGEIARWIPVEEKLPEGAKDVLIRYRVSAQSGLVDSCMSVGWLDGDGHWYGHHNQYFEQEDVTHWQPLPAAPEEKKP